MTSTPTDTPDDDPTFPRRRRVARVVGAVAFGAIIIALLGVALLLRPLATPVQDCGTAASFLLRGGANQYADPDRPPKGVTRDEALANNANPCQEQAANRARPAMVLVLGGVLTAVVALVVEWVLRIRWHRADTRRPTSEGDAASADGPAEAPAISG